MSLVDHSWICYLRFHWSLLSSPEQAPGMLLPCTYQSVMWCVNIQVCQFTMTSRMRHYSVYGTICKHWQEETSECALILLCVISSGPKLLMCAFVPFSFGFVLVCRAWCIVCLLHWLLMLRTHSCPLPQTDFSGSLKQTNDRFSVSILNLDSTNKKPLQCRF